MGFRYINSGGLLQFGRARPCLDKRDLIPSSASWSFADPCRKLEATEPTEGPLGASAAPKLIVELASKSSPRPGVLLGEDASRIRRRPGLVARLRSFALNILRAHGVGNVSEALYTNALSLDRLLAHGLPKSQN